MQRPDLTTATDQQIFDFICHSLIKQGKPSTISVDYTASGISCCYRTSDGLRCAAGHLMPDDTDFAEFEGSDFRQYLSVTGLDLHPRLTKLILDLQYAHDGSARDAAKSQDPGYWLECYIAMARRLALEFKLSTEVLDVTH